MTLWAVAPAASDSASDVSSSTCGINKPAFTSFSYKPDSIKRAYSRSYAWLTCRYRTPLRENRNPLGSRKEAASCPLFCCFVIILIGLGLDAKPAFDPTPGCAYGNTKPEQRGDKQLN